MKKGAKIALLVVGWIILSLVIFFISLDAWLAFMLVSLVVIPVSVGIAKSRQKRKQIFAERHKYGVPDGTKFTNCYGELSGLGIADFWTDSSTLHFYSPRGKKAPPAMLAIPKENIIAFSQTGDISTQTSISGGGTSIGGALVGGAIAGAAGAMIGGRKKVKSKTTTLDTRRTFLKFKDKSGAEKTLQFGGELYDALCMFCLEKKI